MGGLSFSIPLDHVRVERDKSMIIKNISATHYRIPVHIPLIDKPIQHLPVLICTVEFQDGLIGHGLTSHFLLPSVVTALEQDFVEVVRGMDGRNTEQIHDRIHKAINSRWSTGVASMALSALDMALWDAMGKASGRTVAELLGGARDWAPVYITFGFPI